MRDLLETLCRSRDLVGTGNRRQWALVLCLAVVVSVLEAGGMLLIFALLGAVTEDGTASLPLIGDLRQLAPNLSKTSFILYLGAAVGLYFLVRGALILVQNYVQYRVAEDAGANLSTRLLDGYLGMSYEFHFTRNSSELIRNAFDSVQRFIQEGLIQEVKVLAKLAIVVAVLLVLLVTSPLPTLLALALLGPLTWGILRFVQPRVQRLGVTAQWMAKQNIQSLQQCIHGWREIVISGKEQYFVEHYDADRSRLSRTRYLRHTAAEVPRVGLETGIVLFLVVTIAGTVLFGGDALQALPVLGLFGYAAVRLLPEVNQITRGLNSIKFVRPAIDCIHEDLRAIGASSGAELSDAEALPFRRCLSLDNVSYDYPDGSASALKGVALDIPRGQSLGVIGPTGGGKSTLLDVAIGLLEPSDGRVTVDGVDIRGRERSWQKNIGVVPQVVYLIDDTVQRNIALGVRDANVDEDALLEAVEMAQLRDFVSSLPAGLDTPIGELGTRLSGGQRQRLAIARALYRRPSVLVFDEATSALDNRTEGQLLESIERMKGEKTIIAVAHRTAMASSLDRIALVDGGRIVACGSYDEVAAAHVSLSGEGR